MQTNSDIRNYLASVSLAYIHGETSPYKNFEGESFLFNKLNVNPAEGLTEAEANHRLKKNGPNISQSKETRIPKPFEIGLKGLIWSNAANFFLLLLSITKIIEGISYSNDDWQRGIILTTFSGILITRPWVKWMKARSSYRELSRPFFNLKSEKCQVKRDGEWKEIDGKNLTVGDIVRISGETEIHADMIVIESNDLKIDESNIKYVEDPVPKNTQANCRELSLKAPSEKAYIPQPSYVVLAGTEVHEGYGVGVVISVGKDRSLWRLDNIILNASEKENLHKYHFTANLTQELKRINVIVAVIFTFIRFVLFIIQGSAMSLIDKNQYWIELLDMLLVLMIMIQCIPMGFIAAMHHLKKKIYKSLFDNGISIFDERVMTNSAYLDEIYIDENSLSNVQNGIEEPPVQEVSEMQKAGIKIRVMTNSPGIELSALAKQSHIVQAENEASVKDMPEKIEDATDDYNTYDVIGSLTDASKESLIRKAIKKGVDVGIAASSNIDIFAMSNAQLGYALNSSSELLKRIADASFCASSLGPITYLVKLGRYLLEYAKRTAVFEMTMIVSLLVTILFGSMVIRSSIFSPVQLMWIAALNPFAIFALGTDYPDQTILCQAPYKKSIFTKTMVKHIMIQATYQVLIINVMVYTGERWLPENLPGLETVVSGRPYGMFSNTRDYSNIEASRHFTIIFNTFVLMNLFNLVNCRKVHDESDSLSSFIKNKIFLITLCLLIGAQFAVGNFGFSPFDISHESLSPKQWAICFAFGIVPLLLGAIGRYIPIRDPRDDLPRFDGDAIEKQRLTEL